VFLLASVISSPFAVAEYFRPKVSDNKPPRPLRLQMLLANRLLEHARQRTASRRGSPAPEDSSRATVTQVGLMLLLAAACLPSMNTGEQLGPLMKPDHNLGDRCSGAECGDFNSHSGPTHLTYAATLLTELEGDDEGGASGTAADASTARRPMTSSARRRARRAARRASPFASSFASSPSASDASSAHDVPTSDVSSENDGSMEIATDEEPIAVTPRSSVSSTPSPIAYLVSMLSMMSLSEIEALRYTSADLAEAADHIAPKPLAATSDAVFIRWAAPEGDASEAHVHCHKNQDKGPGSFHWRCVACDGLNYAARSCGYCRSPLAQSACRVFLGQLRKEATVALVQDMIMRLTPGVTVLHIESHTNATDGRGKGCAWVYVDNAEQAWALTSMHKRVFVDVDENGGEGYWYMMDEALTPHLKAMADRLSVNEDRPLVLPRQPLVAELPATSLLRRNAQAATPSAANANGTTMRFDARGWPTA